MVCNSLGPPPANIVLFGVSLEVFKTRLRGALKGVDYENPYRLGGEQNTIYKCVGVWEENETHFIRVWKPLPSRFKTLRESPREKVQIGQYLVAVGFGRYGPILNDSK